LPSEQAAVAASTMARIRPRRFVIRAPPRNAWTEPRRADG
jgi:hypothetical protein